MNKENNSEEAVMEINATSGMIDFVEDELGEDLYFPIELDGEWHTFGRNGKCSYIADENKVTFKTYKSDLKKTFWLKAPRPPTSEEKEEQRIERLSKDEYAKELQLITNKKLRDAYLQINECFDFSNKYLTQKGIEGTRGAKSCSKGDRLYIPIFSTSCLVGSQCIYWSSSINKWEKLFPKKIQLKGSFYLLGSDESNYHHIIKTAHSLYLCEGFATACSIEDALPDEKIVCAFFAGNLSPVIKSLRTLNPRCIIHICSDRDYATKTGQQKAYEARDTFKDIEVHVPEFEFADRISTDFNDLKIQKGLLIVRHQIKFKESVERAKEILGLVT